MLTFVSVPFLWAPPFLRPNKPFVVINVNNMAPDREYPRRSEYFKETVRRIDREAPSDPVCGCGICAHFLRENSWVMRERDGIRKEERRKELHGEGLQSMPPSLELTGA